MKSRCISLIAVMLTVLIQNRIRVPVFAEIRDKENVNSVLYSVLLNCEKTADISEFKILRENFKTLYSGLLSESPELFYVCPNYSFSTDGKYVLTVSPCYSKTADEISEGRKIINKYVTETVESAPIGNSEQIALYLHDKICRDYIYDDTNTVYNVCDLIKEGHGVCQAYSGLYLILLRSVGIECGMVSSNGMGHIWNYVKIEGRFYHVDVTWDDTGSELHEFFLKSDAYMLKNRHYGFQNGICTEDLYDNILPGDLNNDGIIDGRDITAYRLFSGVHSVQSDANSDGVSDGNDFEAIRRLALEYYFGIY